MSSLPKLLITGASGFTGKHACRHFFNAGFEVIAVTRTGFFNKQIQTANCDLTNKEDVIAMIKKIKPHYLLHLAGQNHVGKSWIDPIASLEANFLSTLYLIESLRHANPNCKIITVGSALQFDPQNISALTHPYSLSKTLQVLVSQAWELLYKLPIIIAKPSNLIGPGISNGVCSIFARKIVEMEKKNIEKILEVSNLHAQRDFIDVRDVVNAYETLFKKGSAGEVYDIASGQSRSLENVINTFKPLTSVNFELKSQIHDQVEKKVEIETEKLTNLGWGPQIPFEVSLVDILSFYRKNTKI
ncbi:NAD-dependent epimerase/dehydratase family protein [Priestia aryabhattai]|uniref:NAD-dependent epimerase/dehydratase family protein n=1 Tax=Priestia aryabhattai TaxID=412384 RepID=UPI0015F5BE6F|nr:NAD-dependent epimerase/dehydratase family protein [Priestia aryabhattai]MBZ6484003.1 NAD-dependent epimerase/dehydratase family protein [Priestia aryabhattai]